MPRTTVSPISLSFPPPLGFNSDLLLMIFLRFTIYVYFSVLQSSSPLTCSLSNVRSCKNICITFNFNTYNNTNMVSCNYYSFFQICTTFSLFHLFFNNNCFYIKRFHDLLHIPLGRNKDFFLFENTVLEFSNAYSFE